MKASHLILLIPCLAQLSCADVKSTSFCKSSETVVFEFQTRNKKQVGICLGGSGTGEFLVYRFGTPQKVEMEFPKDKDSTFSRFRFYSYLRGGGAENEGLDVNRLSFVKDGVGYQIFEETSASDPAPSVGIRVTLEKTKKEIVIKGIPATIKGTLLTLRDEERIPHDQ